MAATSADHPAAPPFQTSPNVKTSASPTSAGAKDEVESPSISNTSTALARFEFEAGRGSQDGTKVLMVEWEDDDTTRGVRGVWHISWEGKRTVLPASEDKESVQDVHRAYFLLPPGVQVPSIVVLTLLPTPASGQDQADVTPTVIWRTNPLPAIFPPELGASARAAGKKGVLHTIWAKKRLSVLGREISQELSVNVEGVGLMMAMQERDWIEQNFGVTSKKPDLAPLASPGPYLSAGGNASGAISPSSPRSPGGGRLMEKLKGLKLGTSDSELSQGGMPPGSNPLSPESTDVAVSSFSAIKGLQGLSPPTASATGSSPAQHRKMSSQSPPAHVVAQQQAQSLGGMASLDAFAGGGPEAVFKRTATKGPAEEDEKDEAGLFALPMSPRSPEMKKSPFSFKVQDTRKYVGGTA